MTYMQINCVKLYVSRTLGHRFNANEMQLILCVYVSSKGSRKYTDLVEEQDEIESEGDEQGQEPKVVEVARKVVLGDGGGIKK